jgi:hypothetical protein
VAHFVRKLAVPLSLFNHRMRGHFREVSHADPLGHTFGGETAAFGYPGDDALPIQAIKKPEAI